MRIFSVRRRAAGVRKNPRECPISGGEPQAERAKGLPLAKEAYRQATPQTSENFISSSSKPEVYTPTLLGKVLERVASLMPIGLESVAIFPTRRGEKPVSQWKDMRMNPAESLEGLALDGGWTVTQKVTRTPNSTGGHFSVGYLVENSDGRKCFLKAIDFSAAFQASDPARELENLTRAYNFERDLLSKCKNLAMKRIVTPLADGAVTVDGIPPPLNKVSYLIFERATGDIRNQQFLMANFDLAWCLRSLHNVATGLRQLHQSGIAHQDLKPSNVLDFKEKGFKISDLGRATDREMKAEHDNYLIPGDQTYAAPELFYDFAAVTGFGRRQASDIYHMGSLLFFFFADMCMRKALAIKVRNSYAGQLQNKDYEGDLPILQNAFGDVLKDLEPIVKERTGKMAGDILGLIRELCEPDPRVRGDKREQFFKHVGRFNLERYISTFNRLAIEAEREFE